MSNRIKFVILILVLCVLMNVVIEKFYKDKSWIPEEAILSTDDVIQKHGYPVEAHFVETEDGYILSVHRIPRSVNEKSNSKSRIPVLLMHGFICSSMEWVINGPEHAFAYYLADMGFDVWMGNFRGNYYSRKHLYMNPDNEEFWRFSWNEIGIYDLPAMIDYITNVTGHEKLHYIGHSQGATVFFVMASEKPEMNDRILSMQALSPVVYTANVISPLITFFSKFLTLINNVSEIFGIFEFLPKTEFRTIFVNVVCVKPVFFELCQSIYFGIVGPTSEFYDSKMLTIYMSNFPAGSSLRQGLHYLQIYLSGKFRKYDFGIEKNLEIYKTEEPPEYDLSQTTAPVAIYYSKNDWFASELDVKKLYSNLKNPIGVFELPPDFNHLDYHWGKNIHGVVYDKFLNLMLK